LKIPVKNLCHTSKNLKKITAYIALVLVLAACSAKNELPSLRETFALKDDIPLGTSMAFSLTKASFPNADIQVSGRTASETLGWTSNTGSFYISISHYFFPKEADLNAIYNYVANGNTAFISALQMDSSFLAGMYCKMLHGEIFSHMMPLSLGETNIHLKDTSLAKNKYSYYYLPFASYFSATDSIISRTLGYNQFNKPNCIVIFWGKGRLYLHCDARAFSNYFLLSGNNQEYFTRLMQWMPEKPSVIYWDDFYHRNSFASKEGSGSGLAFLFTLPALAMALIVLLLLLLIYMIVGSKRKQRIVPVINAPENASVKFAEAIAGLYLNQKDNQAIADKMILYFNEYVRTNYFIQANTNTTEYTETLSRKSGVQKELVQNLSLHIHKLQNAFQVSDSDLLILNDLVQKFYKSRK